MSHFDLMMNLMCEEATKCTEVSEIAAAAAAAAHCTLHTHTHTHTHTDATSQCSSTPVSRIL